MQQSLYVGDVNSSEFWRRPFRVPASGDSDQDTALTVQIMADHVRAAAGDPLVQATAHGAVEQFAGIAGIDGAGRAAVLAAACWWWAKTYIKFVHHEAILRGRLGEAGHLQGLISPEVLVRMKRPEGDCAIFAECIGAFLSVLGVPFEFVTIKCSPRERSVYSHVYVYAILEGGSRLPLDASHGDYPGWQVPSADINWDQAGSPGLQAWDSAGSAVADRGPRFAGLHNYMLRGLGDACNSSDPDYDFATCIGYGGSVYSESTLPTPFGTGAPAGGYPAGSITAPAQSSAGEWASFASNLAKMGFTLAQINAIQPGTVVGPNGQILRQNPGYAVPVPTGTNITAGIGSNSVWLLGGGLLAFVLVVATMGRR